MLVKMFWKVANNFIKHTDILKCISLSITNSYGVEVIFIDVDVDVDVCVQCLCCCDMNFVKIITAFAHEHLDHHLFHATLNTKKMKSLYFQPLRIHQLHLINCRMIQFYQTLSFRPITIPKCFWSWEAK